MAGMLAEMAVGGMPSSPMFASLAQEDSQSELPPLSLSTASLQQETNVEMPTRQRSLSFRLVSGKKEATIRVTRPSLKFRSSAEAFASPRERMMENGETGATPLLSALTFSEPLRASESNVDVPDFSLDDIALIYGKGGGEDDDDDTSMSSLYAMSPDASDAGSLLQEVRTPELTASPRRSKRPRAGAS